MDKLFKELRRRNVFRVAGVYGVVGWLLAQAAVVMETALGFPSWFDGVVVGFLLIGFPIALVLAWAFEMTPDGMKRTAAVPEGESITAKTGKKLDYAILAGLALVAVIVIADRVMPKGAPEAPVQIAAQETAATVEAAPVDRSIAVLPFANRSARADDAFFAEGVHDDLLTQLAKLPDMRVISRTSVMRYAGTEKAIPEIAAELGVSVVLEGGVQRAGDRVRINMQLIDGRTDAHLWADTFDRELTVENLFDIQSEVTRAIAGALKYVLTGEEETRIATLPTRNTDAWNAYLRGNTLNVYSNISEEKHEQAVSAYDEAIALDPDFARAYARKVEALTTLYWWGRGMQENRQAAEEALAAAERLEPDASETLYARGIYEYRVHSDYPLASNLIERAIAMEPGNADYWTLKATISRRSGELLSAAEEYRHAFELDPLDPSPPASMTYSYALLGRFKDADRWFAEAVAINPENPLVKMNRYWLALLKGDPEAIWTAAEEIYLSSPKENAQVIIALPYIRERERLEKIAATLEANLDQADNRDVAEAALSLVKFRLGDESSIPGLRKAIATTETEITANPENRRGYSGLYYLYALLGDKEKAISGATAVLDNRPADHLWLIDSGAWPIDALAIAGAPERAFDEIERQMNEFSPSHFSRIAMSIDYDGLRDHPRYLELKARYDAWLKAQ